MASQVSESDLPDLLDQLQTPEQVALLDAIDKLRNQGMSHYDISLPQLIVCGDQSCGKSSVLEGVTRLRFPTKEGLCTTFATELVLRKEPKVAISCIILPGRDRSQAERDELSKFKQSFSSRDEFSFPSLLNEARKKMASDPDPDPEIFFEDILQIRYSGPDLPSLTIVDLPGIIHSDMKNGGGIETVRSLIHRYMADERSIILAVVSAKSDTETQIVLEDVKQFDPTASRTLGIITKPDTLDAGSDSEIKFLNLAKNDLKPLTLGWHTVKNRSYPTRHQTDEERDESETEFFATGIWKAVPRSDVGIGTLRTKLSKVLLDHIRQELPSLVGTIQHAISSTESRLEELGSSRDEKQQQQAYLMDKAQKFQTLTRDALRGLYSDPFFALSSPNVTPATRLRTEVQNLNIAFANVMYRKGHRWQINESHLQPGPEFSTLSSSAFQGYDHAFGEPISIERATFLEQHIGPQVRHSRPSGLPSLVNPWVIGEVFRQQSQPWERLAQRHIEHVFEAVRNYIYLALESLMDLRTFNLLLVEQIEPELEKKQQNLKSKLAELLTPYQRQEPITYDPSFISDLEEMRARRLDQRGQSNVATAQKGPSQLLTESLDDFTNSEILILMQAFYKKAISVFINNVAVLAIENCLVADIATIFDPRLVLNMDDEQLRIIASEAEETRMERTVLNQKLQDLKAGKRVLDRQARRSGKLRQILQVKQSVSDTKSPEPQHSRPVTPTPKSSSKSPEIRISHLPPTPPSIDPKTHSRSLTTDGAVALRGSSTSPRRQLPLKGLSFTTSTEGSDDEL